MGKIRVLIAFDHALLRRALVTLINAQHDMEVTRCVSSGEELLASVNSALPELILTDGLSPEGVAALVRQVRELCPAAAILVVAVSCSVAQLRNALEAGAAGCIGRHAEDADVLSAVRQVHQGRVFVDPELAGVVVENVMPYRYTVHTGHKSPGSKQLSRRELEVLEYLLKGYTNQQIADNLLLSVKTTETYRARLKRKLGLKNRADIVRYGMESGLMAGSPS